MFVCDSCKRQISSDQPEQGKSIPAFTLLGGLVSAAGAAATGMLVLVPAGVVLGALVDKSGGHCGMCNSEMGQEEPAWRLMEELGDDMTGRRYKPVKGAASPGPQCPPHSTPDQVTQKHHPLLERDHIEAEPPQLEEDEEDMSVGVTFREHEGRLVPEDPCHNGNQEELSPTDTPTFGLEPEACDGQPFCSGGETVVFADDGFAGFDGPATDIDSFDGFDDPLMGEWGHE